jgi:hypothetical protein
MKVSYTLNGAKIWKSSGPHQETAKEVKPLPANLFATGFPVACSDLKAAFRIKNSKVEKPE